ncbi:MAG: PsbP-related protein [Chloroflexota bacterium]
MKRLLSMPRKQIQFVVFDKPIKIPVYKLIIFLLVVAYFLARHFLLADLWFTLTNETYNFSIEHPAEWRAYTYGRNGSRSSRIMRAEVMQSGFFNSGEIQIYQQFMEKPTLDDAVAWGEQVIQRNDGYDLTSLQEIQIGQNYPALTQTYRIRGGLGGFAKAIYFVTNDSVFMIKFSDLQSGFKENEPTFDRMLASFRIIE